MFSLDNFGFLIFVFFLVLSNLFVHISVQAKKTIGRNLLLWNIHRLKKPLQVYISASKIIDCDDLKIHKLLQQDLKEKHCYHIAFLISGAISPCKARNSFSTNRRYDNLAWTSEWMICLLTRLTNSIPLLNTNNLWHHIIVWINI